MSSAPLLLSLFLSPSSVPFPVLLVSVKSEKFHLIMMGRGRRQNYYFSVIFYDFWLDPHHAHDFYLTEGIVEFSWTHTDFLICTPAHEFFSKLLLARLIGLAVVDVVKCIDCCVVSREMLLCVVFWLQVSQVQFVRLRHVNEEQEEDHGHSQRVDTETECVDTVTDVCLCSDYANTFPFFPRERRFTIIFPRCSQHDDGPGPGPGDRLRPG